MFGMGYGKPEPEIFTPGFVSKKGGDSHLHAVPKNLPRQPMTPPLPKPNLHPEKALKVPERCNFFFL
jgi:hypothetical protein